jgi:hypothetical protein
MMKLVQAMAAALLFGLLAPPTVVAQQASVSTAPEADPADVESIDAIIGAVYDVISGPAGPRDWDRMRSRFIPEAMHISVGMGRDGQFRKRAMDLEGYIEGAGGYFEQSGFFEQELARRTERFEHVAHAFSTYESLRNADDPEPFSRGINSFQLMDSAGGSSRSIGKRSSRRSPFPRSTCPRQDEACSSLFEPLGQVDRGPDPNHQEESCERGD